MFDGHADKFALATRRTELKAGARRLCQRGDPVGQTPRAHRVPGPACCAVVRRRVAVAGQRVVREPVMCGGDVVRALRHVGALLIAKNVEGFTAVSGLHSNCMYYQLTVLYV